MCYDNNNILGGKDMKKGVLFISLLVSLTALSGCNKNGKLTGTIEERLSKSSRIKSFNQIASNKNFFKVFLVRFEQYIDHNNKKLGKFEQTIEFGFNSFESTNVYVSEGYMISNYHYSYAKGENEIAYLLHSNYLCVEHRYFGNSLPVEIDYDDKQTWTYLTTKQAADDAHDIVTEFKRILDGKWVSTGGSKSGMTTELFALYHPGDMDLYVPYVAPFCNSFNDKRMIKFLREETGDLQYGEERAEELRNEVLEFQLKLLEYKNVLAPKYYQAAISKGTNLTSYATQDRLYDVVVAEFEIGFWQYYQSYSKLENCLNLPETTPEEIENKQNKCYSYLTSIIGEDELGIDGAFTPYYVQAYQELGNYGYDFSYIREALTDQSLLTISEEDEEELGWNIVLSDVERSLEQKELVCPRINEMLQTTEDQFIILYGSSDPWYAVRPDDVNDRDNINIYVNDNYPHTMCISNFDKEVKEEIIAKIQSVLAD